MSKMTWVVVAVDPPKGPLDEHVLIVGEHGEETEIMHPESCAVEVRTAPDSWGRIKRYDCFVTSEIDNAGFDGMFPDGLIDGIWLLCPWVHESPSTPSSPPEWDAGVEVVELIPVEVLKETK